MYLATTVTERLNKNMHQIHTVLQHRMYQLDQAVRFGQTTAPGATITTPDLRLLFGGTRRTVAVAGGGYPHPQKLSGVLHKFARVCS